MVHFFPAPCLRVSVLNLFWLRPKPCGDLGSWITRSQILPDATRFSRFRVSALDIHSGIRVSDLFRHSSMTDSERFGCGRRLRWDLVIWQPLVGGFVNHPQHLPKLMVFSLLIDRRIMYGSTGGDRFRPDSCGGGGTSRTLTWPGKKSEQTTTANSDVAGRVGFAAPVRMAA